MRIIGPLVLLVGCLSDAVESEPIRAATVERAPALNELEWLRQLRQRRPDLMVQTGDSVWDPGWQALVIRPEYRATLLSSPDATWMTIVAENDSDVLRAHEQAWRRDLVAFASSLDPQAEVNASRSSSVYAWFIVLRPAVWVGGLDYKVFLTFRDFSQSLVPELLRDFLALLKMRGFEGDFKVDLRPGFTRFNYNQVIFHASSIKMALCTEAVSLEFFGERLAYVTRGVDAIVSQRTFDWHHYLLSHQVAALPPDARAFVEHRTPRDASACPGVEGHSVP